MPPSAASGSATKASPAAIAGPGSPVPDPGIPVMPALAKIASDRDTGNGPGMAPKGVESLLALAFSMQRTIRTTNNSAGREASHSSHGGRELSVGTETYPGGAGKIGRQCLRQDRREVLRGIHRGKPSPGWRNFLASHAREIWACDFFCVQTVFFRTIYVFFIIHHASREVVHVRTTRHPTSEWTEQQIVEACGWDREPPRFLIHDRDSRYGTAFHRLQHFSCPTSRLRDLYES